MLLLELDGELFLQGGSPSLLPCRRYHKVLLGL